MDGTLERETRIELATNSLEGCDSTIELLPHFKIYFIARSSAEYVVGSSSKYWQHATAPD